MKSLINKLLSKTGFTLYSKKSVRYDSIDDLKQSANLDDFDISYLKGKLGLGFKEKLIKENKNRWLDVGCGGKFDDNFYYLDTFPENVVKVKDRYFRADIINLNDEQAKRIGKFDFIRMQHVFEHFTPEDGLAVLKNLSKILNKDGYILITTPDLRKMAYMYLSGKINQYSDWALNRIERDSPDSFYFSIFAHSLLTEKHLWCYDFEGLKYQFERAGLYKNITEITLDHEYANIDFTHNRPNQEVCIIAQLA